MYYTSQKKVAFILSNDESQGPVNIVSPAPITNKTFTRALARALNRPAFIPVPSLGMKLLLGEMAQETALANQNVLPKKLNDLGFTFAHESIDQALDAVISQ